MKNDVVKLNSAVFFENLNPQKLHAKLVNVSTLNRIHKIMNMHKLCPIICVILGPPPAPNLPKIGHHSYTFPRWDIYVEKSKWLQSFLCFIN